MSDPVQHPVLNIAATRLKEFARQPEAVFWVYFFPVLMVIVLGIAFRNKPVEVISVDVAEGPGADVVYKVLAQEETFKLFRGPESECKNRLRTGKTSLVVSTTGSELDGAVMNFDPARPGSNQAREMVENKLQIAAGRQDPIQLVATEYNEPGGRYVDFLVPGLLGMSLMGGGLWGVGFAIVDLRIRKLLKRFMATPMRRSHFLLGMMLSRMVYMVPQIIVLLLFAWLIFGVTVYGNWLSILFIVLLGAFEFSGIGLLVASRAKTIESVSGLMNLIMLPMWTLSGIFFSYERFPEVVQPLIKVLPLTPLIDALRALMTDGKSLTTLGPEITVMTLWTVVTFAVALWIFRWND